jgi:beta-lactamase class A
MNVERIVVVILSAAVAVAGFFGGRNSCPAAGLISNESTVEDFNRQIRAGGYEYINPLIECDCFKPSKQVSTVLMEEQLNNYISMATSSGKAIKVAVYFRDLNNGPWMGINEFEDFTPASLLKVPVMIAALKKAETSPLYLQKKLLFPVSTAEEFKQDIPGAVTITAGKSYTVDELISQMIIHSDNYAMRLLLNDLGKPAFDKVFIDLQVVAPETSSGDNTISVKEYSSFFRILYNASYLNKEMSERALRVLSEVEYKDGLKAGLPDDLLLAHKFGVRGFENELMQVHDCGVVYDSHIPYLICVMSRGRNLSDLNKVIADVSGIIYRNVSRK